MVEEQRYDVSGIDLERPATVFLSYAREDVEDVKDLQLRLNIRGVRSWRDVDNMLVGTPFQDEIECAIEQEVDALALYITPASLKSDFIWKVEVAAALSRHERDPQFHIVPILQGVSYSKVKEFCFHRNLPDVTRFNGISLSDDGTASITVEEQNKRQNEAARRILQAALTLRLRRVKADRNYEAWVSLKTFVGQAPTTCLDLDLDWLKLVYEKERLPTSQEWEQILLPALLDVKQSISEKVHSRRIHLFVKSILPVAVALGFTFREVTRLTLLVEGQKEIWSTDIQPLEEEPLHVDWNYNHTGDVQAAVVEVTTTRSIKQSVDYALSALGLEPAYRIQLDLPQLSRTGVSDAAHAQAIAQQVGRICQILSDQHSVVHIHLFVVVPVELAVLIGHQLNALCPITLYEYSKGIYKSVGALV